MEHEIEAIWPLSGRSSFVGSGPKVLLGDHVNDRGSDALIFILVGGQPRGVRLSHLDSFASSSCALCPSWNFLTPHTEHFNIAVMSCPRPLRSWPPSTSLRSTSLSFSGRSLPWPRHTGLFSFGSDLQNAAPTIILAHSCLGLKSNPRECMQNPAEARDVTASRPGQTHPP